ncbi:MAG TPA: glutamate--tRNA ligase [Pyrinomonadaceae bacterium]|jgi:glutamyl-tRNA synthetase
MSVRVRFAPSPTGYLHVGATRAALFNYLFARQKGGKFLLRIEDTDLARSTEESTRSIIDGLTWIGLEPDEPVVFQSANADKHRATAVRLLDEGKAYRDFTPKEEKGDGSVKQAIVERAREKPARSMRDNPYRDLSIEESDARATAGEPFAIRLKVPESGKTQFEDGVFGHQERDYADTEDLVLLRSDGHPLYNLAVVCDDIEMRITDVIRGQDHLTNTHKQILIYEALGVAPPNFAHLPLILAPGGKKLSKRIHGEIVSLTTYRDAGFLAAAFRNFLALLGWSAGEEREIYSMDELVEKFSLAGVHRSSAIFNYEPNNPKRWTDDKAIWMNAEYIRTMPLSELLPLVKTELKSTKLWREEYEEDLLVGGSADAPSIMWRQWFERTVDLIRHRFFTLKDFSQQGRAYFSEDYDFDPPAVDKNLKKIPDLKQWLPELADRFESEFADVGSPYNEQNIEAVVKTFTEEKGTKLGVIMNGARTLLTGVAVGPSMLSVFETLGKERSIQRLKSQIAWS